MPLLKKIQEQLEKNIANSLIGLGLFALTSTILLSDYLLPESVQELLGSNLIAQIVTAMLLLLVLLSAWVVHVKWPRGRTWEWIEDTGVWRDNITGIRYCVKCEAPVRTAQWGYSCDKCGRTYNTPEYRKKQEEEAAKEQRRIDKMISDHNKRRI